MIQWVVCGVCSARAAVAAEEDAVAGVEEAVAVAMVTVVARAVVAGAVAAEVDLVVAADVAPLQITLSWVAPWAVERVLSWHPAVQREQTARRPEVA